MKNLFIKVGFLFSLVIYLSADQVHANDQLTLWVHPYLPATELISKFSPLAAYLSKKSGRSVEVKVSKSYQSHIKRVGEGQMDLAYMGPASYVKMTHAYGKKTVLACLEINGSPFFHGMIIALENSAIKTLQDLQGHSRRHLQDVQRQGPGPARIHYDWRGESTPGQEIGYMRCLPRREEGALWIVQGPLCQPR